MKHSTRVSLIGSLGWQILLLISVSMHSASAQTPPPDCAPASTALAFWRPVRAAANTNEVNANALAPALAACLAAPDSELRDAIAYELFTYWLRNEQLTASSQTELLSALSANLTLSGNDNSLRRSFSALILSELLRADNINAFMTTEQRSRLLELAVETLEGRGFWLSQKPSHYDRPSSAFPVTQKKSPHWIPVWGFSSINA